MDEISIELRGNRGRHCHFSASHYQLALSTRRAIINERDARQHDGQFDFTERAVGA